MHTKEWFDSPEFEREYHYDGPLGAFCSLKGTTFRLWAPTAQQVTLFLYEAGDGGVPVRTIEMLPGGKGTWAYTTDENLDGMYYDYQVMVQESTYQTQDPYARSCGVNGLRSMVLDLRRTDPENWLEDKAPVNSPEQVIYELHIRDFSWDLSGGFDGEKRGQFRALCQEGTTLHGEGTYATGVDYLKNLGVTHIQLLPMYDYGSVDERNPQNGYNWGYDPVNYNIPEGSYSSDPYHGEIRIRELKEMVAFLHSRGFRVIMDVVYNHTYELESCLFKTAPWYYYRQNKDGTPANGSGCGNDIASERSMCSRYILESALYWVEEYHLDGFRFDLMGLLDVELMSRLQEELDLRYGKGEKLVYGEPWRAADTAVRPGTVLADKSNLKKLPISVGAFCDDTRDAVKGSVMDKDDVGFVNGGCITPEVLGNCITAWVGEGKPNQVPSQTISYLSCHDDWTLWDKLVYTMDPEKDFTGSKTRVLQANRLAAALLFACQGRIFIHAGEEFGRTKGGIKNSYCSGAQINQLDWARATENAALVDYYRGFITLRQQLTGLQDKSESAMNRLQWVRQIADNCVAACLDNRAEHSQWQLLLMSFNCSDVPVQMNLPEGEWQLLADGENSFCWQNPQYLTGAVVLQPHSALWLGQ